MSFWWMMSLHRSSGLKKSAPALHVDLDSDGQVIGVECLYPRTNGVPVSEVCERYGVELEIPFSFAA